MNIERAPNFQQFDLLAHCVVSCETIPFQEEIVFHVKSPSGGWEPAPQEIKDFQAAHAANGFVFQGWNSAHMMYFRRDVCESTPNNLPVFGKAT